MNETHIDFFKKLSSIKPTETESEFEQKQLQRVIEGVNESAGIPRRFWNVSVSDYDFGFDVAEFATKPNNDGVCLIVGNVGQGKTTMLCAAIHERAIKGLAAGYYMSNMTLDIRIRSLRSFSSKETEFDFFTKMSNIAFLCIDEVGTSDSPAEERKFLRKLLAARFDNMLPTMIATNLTNSQFKKFMLGIDDLTEMSKEELNERCKRDSLMDRLFSVVTAVTKAGNNSFRKVNK